MAELAERLDLPSTRSSAFLALHTPTTLLVHPAYTVSFDHNFDHNLANQRVLVVRTKVMNKRILLLLSTAVMPVVHSVHHRERLCHNSNEVLLAITCQCFLRDDAITVIDEAKSFIKLSTKE